jgi:choline-sulfatase
VKTLIFGVLSVVLLAAGLLWLRSSRSAAPVAARPNIVLVTIDTLRADRVQRGLTPTLDALGASGLRFSHARTAVPLTLPSHTTIMTGLLPSEHGVRQNGERLAPTVPTLATRLQAAGYRTGAFVGAYVLDNRFGLARGFDRYDDRVRRNPESVERLEAERRGSEVVDAANAWLADIAPPFFLWVHLYDPHAPYDPPPEFLARAAGIAYDGEVAYADAQVGRLLELLRKRGLQSNTVISVAGDHGEGLGEHGEDTHGMLAYDSTLRVPLIASGPGLSTRTVDAPVSLVDLAPSLLRLAGISDGAGTTAGPRDLFGTLSSDRDVYAETTYPRVAGWHALSVLAGPQWKLVMSSAPELYDLARDPGETTDVASNHSAVVGGMQARIRQLATDRTASVPAVSPEATERLRALGYVSGPASSSSLDPNAPNPAKVIDSWTRFESALALLNTRRTAEALPLLADLVRRFTNASVFQSTYARALMDSGKAAEAIQVYRAAVARWPNDGGLFHELAVAARSARQPAEALRAEQAALAIDGSSPAALNGLGLLHSDAGRAGEAAAAFERATKGDPSNASYWTNLGNARRERQDLAGAESAYRRALEADAAHPDAANGLGVLLVQQGKPADAIPWLERAIQHSPDFYEARLNLGIAYQQSGNREKAKATYQALLASAPPEAARERQAATALLQQLK